MSALTNQQTGQVQAAARATRNRCSRHPITVPRPKAILERILLSDGIDLDGFRLSLWSGFYTNPVFAGIERTYGVLRDENNILSAWPITGR